MSAIKLLCIGDSLTYGYETESSKRWTNLLEIELGIEVFNYGINGDTTSGMLARLMNALNDFKPTHTLIFGGTNDLWFGLKDEFIVSNIYAMTKQAIYANSIPIIGIPTPSFNLNEVNFISEDYSECIRSFQQVLINHCKNKENYFIDFSKNLDKDCFMNDGIHYNDKGHYEIMKMCSHFFNNQLLN
ncbi:GDSL-type esterase/lipase family protein [Yeosuana marina]|uniref:GDSL-type esterase/lipase family protein n=1 Tax=Yeosuana marina TaxID=1565536 RepID=UPI0030ED51BA|tara:strand:- start:634 stop:1194 length:561 start_codon:yes stop_codon:yes gene_type:complete